MEIQQLILYLYILMFIFLVFIIFSYISAIKISLGDLFNYEKFYHLIFIFFIIFLGVSIIIHYIFLYYENKNNFDKAYLFSDEYYYIFKAIKKVIFDYTIILLMIIFILIFSYIRRIKCKCNCLNIFRIAQIIKTIILILCFVFLNFIN